VQKKHNLIYAQIRNVSTLGFGQVEHKVCDSADIIRHLRILIDSWFVRKGGAGLKADYFTYL
jgi:hypothetical protein